MRVKKFGAPISLYKSNQIWRESRAKHNQRDSQINSTMNRAIFGAVADFTYNQNSMILRQATMRVLKTI